MTILLPRFGAILLLCTFTSGNFFSANAQRGGRFEAAKRQGMAYLESGQFDRAAAHLEEIWEQDQSDPVVAEGLAIAYLNGEERDSHPGYEPKVRELLRQSLKLGGKASFLVQHSHEKIPILQGSTISDYCAGTLSISTGRLVFVAFARRGVEQHSFELSADELQLVPPSRGDKQGAFHIKTKAKTYSMVPRTRAHVDGELIISVLQENLSLIESGKDPK